MVQRSKKESLDIAAAAAGAFLKADKEVFDIHHLGVYRVPEKLENLFDL